VGCPRVCVVTNSATIRETVAIVLGSAFEVSGLSPEACTADAHQLTDADLLIVSGDLQAAEGLGKIALRLPLVRLGSEADSPHVRGKKSVTIPLSFRPQQLRRQVDQLIARPPVITAPNRTSFLAYPFVPRELEELAQRAAVTRMPILISGESGTGKSRLARAVHAASGESRFVALGADGLTPTALAQIAGPAEDSLTIYIHDVAGLDIEGQRTLLEICDAGGFEAQSRWNPCRLICATETPLQSLAAKPSFNADLFYRLSVLPMTLPPLRDRSNDIAHLAAALARDLGQLWPNRLFSLTARAVERMERYMWFGNLAEMEAVLSRSMTMAPASTIDAEDLLFDSTRVALQRTVGAAPVRVEPAVAEVITQPPVPDEIVPTAVSDGIAPEIVDLVIQELAHEFRNPMVTIKALTQRLERLLEDKTSRDQVTRMTGEAVDRMDRTLENLLQFTRFGKPITESIRLSPLVTNCLSQLSPAFAERQVLLNYEPPDAHRVEVDGAQVGYAIENLLRVVLRDLHDGDTLAIHPSNGHGISLEFPARGQLVADKLNRMVDHCSEDEGGAQSIGFLFAKALVERNGGKIEVHPQTGKTVIAVALPGQGDIAVKNGNTSNTSSR